MPQKRFVCVQIVLIVSLMLSAEFVYGQLSARQLVWSSVKKYGPEYSDVEKAVASFRQKNVVQARAELVKAIEAHPELAPADTMMALLHLSVGNTNQAKKSLDLAIQNAPEDPESLIILGDLALQQRDFSVAHLAYHKSNELLESFSNQVRHSDLKIRTLGGLSAMSEARSQFELAAQYLEAWQKLAPRNPVPVGSLGRVNFYAKNYDRAREFFTQLKQLDKSAPAVEIAMGGLYSDNGMYEQALKEMKLAVEKTGDDIRTRINVAEWAIGAGLHEMGEENIQAALKLEPKSVVTKLLQARLAQQTQQMEQAEKILFETILLAPDDFAVTNELARTFAVSSDPSKVRRGLSLARKNFQKYRNLKSGYGSESIFTFAWLLHQNNRFEEAAATLNALPNGVSISNENAYFAARIFSHMKNKSMAINALNAALKEHNDFPGRPQAEELLRTLTESKTLTEPNTLTEPKPVSKKPAKQIQKKLNPIN